jgi:hypothetical protein
LVGSAGWACGREAELFENENEYENENEADEVALPVTAGTSK